jgi:ankyrin repeat protein
MKSRRYITWSVFLLVLLFAGCGNPQRTARQEMEHKGLSFSGDAFIDRVRRGDLEAVNLFLAAGMNPDVRDRNGATVLMNALIVNDIGIVETLLNKGADVNAQRENGSTALHFAAVLGNNQSARLLLKKGADVNARNREGETTLMHAKEKNHPDVAQVLREAGARE